MRRYMVVIAVAIVVGLGVKQLFFSHSAAMPNVDTVKGAGIDIAKLHVGAELPVQAIHDMTVLTASD
jgi:hypothetical protein